MRRCQTQLKLARSRRFVFEVGLICTWVTAVALRAGIAQREIVVSNGIKS